VEVGTVDPAVFPSGQEGGFVEAATPINGARNPADLLCHGVGAPIFPGDGDFEVAEYGAPDDADNPPLMIGGFTDALDALVDGFC
jgi:hypothetical protein